MKNIINNLFPGYIIYHQVTGQWNIKVTTDFFGNYNETKYCWFKIFYSKKLNKYKLKISGYKPHEHNLFDIYTNHVSELNKKH